jgi:hypothetical protein
MKIIKTCCLVFLLPLFINAQSGWPDNVSIVVSKASDSVIVEGDLATGSLMEDLSWAYSSTNACFPSTKNPKFRGNHVFYATTITPHSILRISVTPDDPDGDLSIYGYMLGQNDFDLVPDLPRCITCEADHKWDGVWKNRVQTSERAIEFQNPTDRTYNILIGVSAPKGVTAGKFNLKVKSKN